MASRRQLEQEEKWKEHVSRDPEQDSELARVRALAERQGTPEGYDPRNGERAAVTYRQLYNETNGDAAAAERIFRDVARAGGYGDVPLDQALDVRGLERSVRENHEAAERGIDPRGRPLDKFGKRSLEQAAQHQDNLVNAVGEALDRLRKG